MQTLRNAGYCWVRMPDDQIAPLQLLKRKKSGEVDQLNTSITTIFEPNTYSLPAVSRDVELTKQISGEEVIDLKLQANVSVLQGLLKVFSKNADADYNYQNSNTGTFSLVEPKRNYIDVGVLDSFISNATLLTSAQTTIEDLKNDDLYVITEIIKTKGFTLETSAANKNAAGINLGTTVADGNASFEANRSSKNIMKQEGDTYITVAVKAYRIYYKRPGLFSNKPATFRIKQQDLDVVRKSESGVSELEKFDGTLLNNDVNAREFNKST